MSGNESVSCLMIEEIKAEKVVLKGSFLPTFFLLGRSQFILLRARSGDVALCIVLFQEFTINWADLNAFMIQQQIDVA